VGLLEVPATVREVCRVLAAAGHQAVTVGGAVRDALLGREPGDWDVATSAHPDDVVALFDRTIPTGIQHGTVTVLIGHGRDRLPVEVTTFRGEGAYSDARRPDHVVFGVALVEDLARRDLTVNAIAYDPERDELIDPFDGKGDIAARRLRAVGTAVDRFTEDGLRVMRAIRFAAVLDFALDPDTEAAIAPALPSLTKVSRERVRDELMKTLATARPSIGLVIAERTGVLAQILPELAVGQSTIARVDAAAADARLAALLVDLVPPASRAAVADDVLRRLKLSNAERDVAVRALRVADAADGEIAVRRALSAIGRAAAPAAIAVWRARSAAGEGDRFAPAADHADRVLGRGDPLAIGDLAITGGDLMSDLGLVPGPLIGRILSSLLDAVLDDPERNRRDALLGMARREAGLAD
jgi:tRNA nucleotidyltransferase (CCA-adding enzyme)